MFPDVFNAKSPDAWHSPAQLNCAPRPDFADDEELKKAFGIALAKGLTDFAAGLETFVDSTSKALWAAANWKNDPIVNASKDSYLKTLKKAEKPLDKEELLSEVLAAARGAGEDKDRAAFFKLYSEIAGFTGKVQVDASTNYNNNTDNSMKIVLVGGSEKSRLDNSIPNLNTKSRMTNEEIALPKLKLVGGVSRS